ncbi:MAG: TrkH family potassium uptake protein [Acidobacteria bacterium]|nr:TrkH family potassium uptake protein [Acidobacteriota bacterium]
MRLAVVVHVTGTLVRLFAPALIAPAAVAALYDERRDVIGFLVAFVAAALLGTLMRRAGGPGAGDIEGIRRIDGMAIVAGTWLLIAHLGAIPYVWAGLAPIDALFEAMSGFTTTGATVFTDFTAFGRGIFFWRALTQWVGGLGVVALVVAVLPRLAIGGRELFFAEAAGPTDEKLTPQLRQTAIALWSVYIGLTLAEISALALAGMSLFDAICHAFTTMAAGGFSPHPRSIAGYNSAAIDWIVTVFMFAAGANFAVQYRAARGSRVALVQDDEFRAYTGVVLIATVAVFGVLLWDGLGAAGALRHAAFQVVSILTTTGYASADFQLWSDQAKIVLLLLMFIGGCAGSAAGGPKVVRHVLMARLTLRELRRTLHPRSVLPVKLGGRVVPEHILRDVQVFMLFYLLAFAVGTAIVIALGADLVTGITSSIACLGNIGPGFNAVGPMASFADLHPISKIVLTLQMWIGRLEVMTVLVFLRLEPWRAARWGAA